jgi:hypothetical protein
MCLREAVEFLRCAIRGLAVCTRSSRCTVWLLWQQDTGANVVLLDLQHYQSSRRRPNVRAVRSSRAPPTARSSRSRQIFQCMLCMLCMLLGHSPYIIVTSAKYLKELNASGMSTSNPPSTSLIILCSFLSYPCPPTNQINISAARSIL